MSTNNNLEKKKKLKKKISYPTRSLSSSAKTMDDENLHGQRNSGIPDEIDYVSGILMPPVTGTNIEYVLKELQPEIIDAQPNDKDKNDEAKKSVPQQNKEKKFKKKSNVKSKGLKMEYSQKLYDSEDDGTSSGKEKMRSKILKSPPTPEPNSGRSTQRPSTQRPSTRRPSTRRPSTQRPSTQRPSTQGPSTQRPSTPLLKKSSSKKRNEKKIKVTKISSSDLSEAFNSINSLLLGDASGTNPSKIRREDEIRTVDFNAFTVSGPNMMRLNPIQGVRGGKYQNPGVLKVLSTKTSKLPSSSENKSGKNEAHIVDRSRSRPPTEIKTAGKKSIKSSKSQMSKQVDEDKETKIPSSITSLSTPGPSTSEPINQESPNSTKPEKKKSGKKLRSIKSRKPSRKSSAQVKVDISNDITNTYEEDPPNILEPILDTSVTVIGSKSSIRKTSAGKPKRKKSGKKLSSSKSRGTTAKNSENSLVSNVKITKSNESPNIFEQDTEVYTVELPKEESSGKVKGKITKKKKKIQRSSYTTRRLSAPVEFSGPHTAHEICKSLLDANVGNNSIKHYQAIVDMRGFSNSQIRVELHGRDLLFEGLRSSDMLRHVTARKAIEVVNIPEGVDIHRLMMTRRCDGTVIIEKYTH